ncbi:MAG: DUF4854 domain-containing protein [Muribaculaceae bacterium]|nr:DUF4854 domain-containing protein [Muribaculaceae bacterium]
MRPAEEYLECVKGGNVMKSKTWKMLACAAVAALSLSVTACGGSDDKAETVDTEAVVEESGETGADSAADEEQTVEVETTVDEEQTVDTEAVVEESGETEADSGVDETQAAAGGTEADSDALGMTLEDYFSDPTLKSMMEAQFASLADQGMSASVDVKGNELVVTVKIEDSSMVDETTGAALAAGLDAAESQFADSIKEFDGAVGEEGACTMTMRYLDPDGNVLAEKSYSAK